MPLDGRFTPTNNVLLSPHDSLNAISSPDCKLSPAGKLLTQAIIEKGQVFIHREQGNEEVPILDVTSFINCRVEPKLMQAMAGDLALQLKSRDPQTILTAPVSGNIPAFVVAQELGIPLCFAQNDLPVTFRSSPLYSVKSHSPTKGTDTILAVSENLLPRGANIAIIDDISRTGGKLADLCQIADIAQCQVVAVATLIEMLFAQGRDRLKQRGLSDEQIISLIQIEDMKPGEIQLRGIPYRLSLVNK